MACGSSNDASSPSGEPSGVFERKMKTFFARLDVDNDGKITYKDFEVVSLKIVAKGSLEGEKADQVMGVATELWEIYKAQTNNKDEITPDDFIEAMGKVKEAEWKKIFAEPLTVLFNVLDFNNAGYITSAEYEIFCEILGIDPTSAKKAFEVIDTNKDNKLSKDEFVHSGVDFWNKKDTPNKCFYGPLVD